MELYKREFLISRIRAGYIPIVSNGKRYKIYSPNKDITLRANEIYIEEYEKAIEEQLFDDQNIYNFLIAIDLWSEQKEKELKDTVPKHIEYWKIELYKNILKSNSRNTIRKYLETAKQELNNLYSLRHSFDHITCAGYANYIKNMFIIANCTRYNNKKVNWNIVDLNKIMNLYYVQLLDSDTIRTLSRSTPWSGLWSTLKINGKIFENNYLSVEQQSLISWSTMYDKIYESPDCPPDEVIEDDDMLDGWLLVQRRKREVDKKKQELESTLNKKNKNADDIFLMAETPEDISKIDMLNDERAMQIKKQRMKETKDKGTIEEQQLSDVKQKYAMQMTQAYSNQMKGRR